MKYLVLIIAIIFIYLIVKKITKESQKQEITENINSDELSLTDKNYRIIVKRKRKEEKK